MSLETESRVMTWSFTNIMRHISNVLMRPHNFSYQIGEILLRAGSRDIDELLDSFLVEFWHIKNPKNTPIILSDGIRLLPPAYPERSHLYFPVLREEAREHNRLSGAVDLPCTFYLRSREDSMHRFHLRLVGASGLPHRSIGRRSDILRSVPRVR